jgi:phosphohistidine phosphatase SixA
MVIGDCSTQRNLDERGREQARRIGEILRERGVVAGAVLSSQLCRARETADLAFPGQVQDSPAFNSFFGNRDGEPRQTAEARRILLGWKGPGSLVVFTHQVNISALAGQPTASGEGIILRRDGESLSVTRRIRMDQAAD